MKYVAVIMGTTEILRSVFRPPFTAPLFEVAIPPCFIASGFAKRNSLKQMRTICTLTRKLHTRTISDNKTPGLELILEGNREQETHAHLYIGPCESCRYVRSYWK